MIIILETISTKSHGISETASYLSIYDEFPVNTMGMIKIYFKLGSY